MEAGPFDLFNTDENLLVAVMPEIKKLDGDLFANSFRQERMVRTQGGNRQRSYSVRQREIENWR